MKLIIDIPNGLYNAITNDKYGVHKGKLYDIIRNGTPLPKGHGRLIDADSLIKAIEKKAKRLSNADTINGLCGAVALIFDEQTIIEADAKSEETV